MTADEFVRNVYMEKQRLLHSYFDVDGAQKTQVAAMLQQLKATPEQWEQLKAIASVMLTDMCYTLLLGLDGEACIGPTQMEYKLYDQDDQRIGEVGEIEAEAYAYFFENKLDDDTSW